MDLHQISAAGSGKGRRIPGARPGDAGEVFHEITPEMPCTIRANDAAAARPF